MTTWKVRQPFTHDGKAYKTNEKWPQPPTWIIQEDYPFNVNGVPFGEPYQETFFSIDAQGNKGPVTETHYRTVVLPVIEPEDA